MKHPKERRIGFARSPRIVADFDTLEHLVDHAARELGATHVSGDGPTTKIYFPRGGTHPYEAASVRRKGGYWHADGPGAREGVAKLPVGAKPLSGAPRSRRAAEAQAPRRGGAETAGKRYAEQQIKSDHFDNWVRDQLAEAASMPEDQVLPLETPDDARKIARRMLQQLEWDAKRDSRDAPIPEGQDEAFWKGFHKYAMDSVPWLADELLTLKREMAV